MRRGERRVADLVSLCPICRAPVEVEVVVPEPGTRCACPNGHAVEVGELLVKVQPR